MKAALPFVSVMGNALICSDDAVMRNEGMKRRMERLEVVLHDSSSQTEDRSKAGLAKWQTFVLRRAVLPRRALPIGASRVIDIGVRLMHDFLVAVRSP